MASQDPEWKRCGATATAGRWPATAAARFTAANCRRAATGRGHRGRGHNADTVYKELGNLFLKAATAKIGAGGAARASRALQERSSESAEKHVLSLSLLQ